jgi:hypothetical protein
MKSGADTLPDDPVLLKQMLLSAQGKLAQLQEQNALLLQRLFGRKSEQTADPDSPQLPLLNEAEALLDVAPQPAVGDGLSAQGRTEGSLVRPSVWEGWQRWRAWLRHARDSGLAPLQRFAKKPQALYTRHPRQRSFSHAHQPAGGPEQPHQGDQAHGLWFPGLELLLSENQDRLPRESAMNLFIAGLIKSTGDSARLTICSNTASVLEISLMPFFIFLQSKSII